MVSAVNGTTMTESSYRKGIVIPLRDPSNVDSQSAGHWERVFTKEGVHPYDEVGWKIVDAEIRNSNGEIKFQQKGVEVPEWWNQNTVNVVADKYFRMINGMKENSVKQMISRVVSVIRRWAEEQDFFNTSKDAGIFDEELTYSLLHQYGAFNSPVWFNLGIPDRKQTASACFISGVDDTLESICDFAKSEKIIFAGGSGSGANMSRIRSSYEKLSSGAYVCGPIGWMEELDKGAKAMKSGGSCLAPYQRVYTANGPIPVIDLANNGEEFVVLSYDPPAGRYKAKKATAWLAGQKEVLRITTDKGSFDFSSDHPFKLSTGEFIQADSLRPGMSLFACTINTRDGYIRVNLKDGNKGRELLHRMVARDVLGWNIDGMSVHHDDENKLNCSPSNLCLHTDSTHVSLHSKRQIDSGTHIFQIRRFPKFGITNPLHRDSSFWKDIEKVNSYKSSKSKQLLESGSASEMQRMACASKLLQTGYKIINSGGSVDTFELYAKSRRTIIGPYAAKHKLMSAIVRCFGDYDNFIKALSDNNHRVVSVISVGFMDVYNVNVQCPTEDDKSPSTGHNFVVWSDDSVAGSGIVVANTRNAAKMAVMDMDHPDILITHDGRPGFIRCKATEEKRAHDLIGKCGYSAAYDDSNSAYKWVSFQNANHSVSIPDEFMEAVVHGRTWHTRERLTGRSVHNYDARMLWNEIAQAAWFCGDPGIQFSDTINRWHTTPDSGRINSSNPCSEFLNSDDTACNLCAINLTKFFDFDSEKPKFVFSRFEQAVRIFSTSQMAIVDKADYPTEKIRHNSLKLRPIGTNYGDLGALLMKLGYSYDSDTGRAVAARLASLMTGVVYETAAKLAARLGPFSDFGMNRDAMLEVIAMHRDADHDIVRRWNLFADPLGLGEGSAVSHSKRIWNDVMDLGSKYGFYVHQATLQAPLGTISFLMGMDTTGIEPAFSLVSYKSLVGGGHMKIVNAAIPQALSCLGYTSAQIQDISNYIETHDYIEGAPHFNPEHLNVFDCAMPSGPSMRYLSPMAHIKMMAAIQPLITCAQSKTVNLPKSVTPQEIADVYMECWRLGVKCIALYRDGCKLSQPLSTKKSSDVLSVEADSDVEMKIVEIPVTKRRHMPENVSGHRHRFEINSHKGYIVMNEYPDGALGEVFLKLGKNGSTMGGLIDGFTQLLSIALQYGVPLPKLIRSFIHTKFEPSGFTRNPDIRFADSLYDYLFKLLDLRYFEGKNSGLNLQNSEPEVENSGPSSAPPSQMNLDAPPCQFCGAITRRNGSCYLCMQCGATSGCS